MRLLCYLTAGILIFAGLLQPARAVVVNVGGLDYNITTITGTYAANSALLTQQPWYTNSPTSPGSALTFANALGNQLGLTNTIASTSYGPIFAYYNSGFDSNVYASAWTTGGAVNFNGPPLSDGVTYTYAIATLLPEINGAGLSKAVLLLMSIYLVVSGKRRGHSIAEDEVKLRT
jgi:hypothetical protein